MLAAALHGGSALYNRLLSTLIRSDRAIDAAGDDQANPIRCSSMSIRLCLSRSLHTVQGLCPSAAAVDLVLDCSLNTALGVYRAAAHRTVSSCGLIWSVLSHCIRTNA